MTIIIIIIIIMIMIMIMIRFVTRTYPPCWVLKARIQEHRGKPLLFHDKCPGFFYVHYTTHGTYMYSFTSHPNDEAIMVKCLAQGYKRRDRLGRDLNSHSGNTRTRVQCTRPLGHNMSHCCVHQCVNDSRYSDELSIHTFPNDKPLRKIWAWSLAKGQYMVSWLLTGTPRTKILTK